MELARRGCAPATPTVLGCDPSDVALTGSTTDGVNTVIGGLDLRPGDEILTSDEEHPGLLAPLGRARRRHGVKVRVVPFAELAGEVTSSTRLIACSHVSWVGGAGGRLRRARRHRGAGAARRRAGDRRGAGRRARARVRLLRRVGSEVAVRARGQRLPVRARGPARRPARPVAGLRLGGRARERARVRARRGGSALDHGFPAGMRSTWALASLGVFEAAGWDWVHDAGRRRWRPISPTSSPSAGSRSCPAAARRWSRGRSRTPTPRSRGSPTRAWSSAASRRSGSCGRRSARGPRRRRSSGWWHSWRLSGAACGGVRGARYPVRTGRTVPRT